MAGEQHSATGKAVPEALNEPLLRLLIEIDHHVSTEDEIEWAGEWPHVHQVQITKLNDAAQFGSGAEFSLLIARHKEPIPEIRRHRRDSILVVNSSPRGRQHRT